MAESGDRYHIHSGDSLTEERVLVLKQGDSFGVFNGHGDAEPGEHSPHGLFVGGTRHLSCLRVKLLGFRGVPLGAGVTRDGTRIAVDLTNPDLSRESDAVAVRRGSLHAARLRYLFEGTATERLVVTNHETSPLKITVDIEFEADYADVFEVRGVRRPRRGSPLPARVGSDTVTLGYKGLDGVVRSTAVRFEPPPARLTQHAASYEATLKPGGATEIHICVSAHPKDIETPPIELHARLGRHLRDQAEEQTKLWCGIESSHELLSGWTTRSAADLRALLTTMNGHLYPFAGVPWYCCPFGRDGIITALQLLWVNPDVARGVLAFLAAHQATEVDPARDAEPGKILHEMRGGEMAALGEVPFGRYYGTVDATPLFVVLAGAYFRATGDLEFIAGIRGSIERALEWMDRYGDLDGDGFIEHRTDTREGLVNHGWRDSHDAVFHADGSTPRGPLALCEVQAYAYHAKRQGAMIFQALGDDAGAGRLRSEAAVLRSRFDAAFWRPSMGGGEGTYALALDGNKRACDVVSSNAGHCLFAPIALPERARAVAQSLLGPSMYCGWGVRTVGTAEARYNPMSYHNGSVWPHDNAMIALGLKRYGFRAHASALLRCWLEASTYLDMHRLPELVCGFERVPDRGPVLYPVACSPQAWAAGAVFMLLEACLGLRVECGAWRAGKGKESGALVRIHRPHLPKEIEEIRLRGLRVGTSRLDLAFRCEKAGVDVRLLDRDGPARVIVTR